MSGCFGGSVEDRMAEAELDRWLESGFGEEEIEARAADLMAQAISPKFARELALDHELLVNDEDEIIEITADCVRDCERNHAHHDAVILRQAMLGRAIIDIVRRRLRDVARNQLEREA